MKSTTCSLTRAIRRHALLRWSAQPTVPASPGAFTTPHRYDMCLGAVLAEAATRVLEDDRAAEAFLLRLSVGGSKATIANQFVHLGWSVEFAWEKIYQNDRTSEDNRKAVLQNEIESFSMLEHSA